MVNAWTKRLQLLFILSIYFVYMIIKGLIENNMILVSFWTMFTLVYLISLTIALVVLKKYQKQSS